MFIICTEEFGKMYFFNVSKANTGNKRHQRKFIF